MSSYIVRRLNIYKGVMKMRIMPSGNGGYDWVPRETGLNKTASNKDGEVQEVDYKDELFQAAKKVVAGLDCCSDEFGGDELNNVGNELTKEVPDEFAPDADAVDFAGDVNEVSEESPEVDAVECLEQAKDAIEEAVECLGGGEGDDEEFEAEVELDLEDDEAVEDEDVVEGGVGCGEVVAEQSEECEVVASTDDWVKVADINPRTRKKVMNYWATQLGYPKDFVKLMVKDYEK